MSARAPSRRVFFLANPDKPRAAAALEALQSFAAPHCCVAGAELAIDGAAALETNSDRIVVIGGDGTLIGVARSLGAEQVPLIGVNVGKLGFLTEFSVDALQESFRRAIEDDTLVSRRTLLQASIERNGKPVASGVAINDCVIQAGQPFRIIQLGVSIDDRHLTDVAGDGLIVCTPTGSTAHNLSAGGPIVLPGVDAIVLTPLCPHSLTHKPLVIECDASIEIQADSVNEGTTAIIDGQVSFPLGPGDRVVIRRFGSDLQIVRNPNYDEWNNLVAKLHWGRSPANDG